MKIPSGSQNTQPRATTPADALKSGEKRGVNAAEAAEGVDPTDTETATRDFASVLDEVSSGAGEGERRGGETHNNRLEAEPKERASESPFAKRREERKGGDSSSSGGDSKGGGFEQRAASLRETTSSAQEQPGARMILHIADLERIVSAVRTQTVAGGVREVTIELRRSVLEGLRVKLSTDNGGRVTAEFIAASERVRAQVDARASELAELMRSRGINLAEVRAGVGDSGADSRGGGQFAESGEGPTHTSGVARESAHASDIPDVADGGANAEESGTTYRG
jgi:hypothetical protein